MLNLTACVLCGLYFEVSGGVLASHAAPIVTGYGCAPAELVWVCDSFNLNGSESLHGSLALGLEWQPRAWVTLAAELRHSSAPRVHDAGEDGAWLKARFFPFRRRP